MPVTCKVISAINITLKPCFCNRLIIVEIHCHPTSPTSEGVEISHSPLNGRTADANRRSLAKGGEEKSPYSPNFSTTLSRILDVECTIALLLFDNVDR